MKRFWHTFLAIVAVAAMVNTANAQSSSRGEIGSYQSILSRAGYDGLGSGSVAGNQAPIQTAPGTGLSYGAPTTGCPGGNCGIDYATNAFNSGQAATDPGAYGAYGHTGGAVPTQGSVNGFAGNVEGGAVIDQGYVGGTVVDYSQPSQVTYGPSTWSEPVYSEPVYSEPIYSEPVYQPVIVETAAPRRRASNLVFGVFGVNFRRDFEDGVKLGYSDKGDFFSDDLRHGNLSGLGFSLANRKSNGTGWEARYWGLDESDSRDYSGGATHLKGLRYIFHNPATYTAKFIFDNAQSFTLRRSSRINSLAFNLLQNGGQYHTRHGKCANCELFAGFRIFEFDEDFSFIANSRDYPTRLEYNLEAENFLTGFQVGARNEICLSKRLRLSKGLNVGIFNNRINTSQRIFDERGFVPRINSGRNTGTPFDFRDRKDDVAFLGEFNAGLIFQVSKRARLNVGYRAIGVAGVALAAEQIPRDFTDVHSLQKAQSNGSLLLHGFYYGAEFCF